MKYQISYIKNFFLALIILGVQIFLTSHNLWWANFLFTPSIIILTSFFENDLVYFLIFIVGFGLSFLSILPFGTYILLFGILFVFLKYFLHKIFSHVSFLAMIFYSTIGLVFYQFLILLTNKFLYWIHWLDLSLVIDKIYFKDAGLEILLSLALIIILSLTLRLSRKHYYV